MRLFIALWPEAPVRHCLATLGEALAERASGKPVPAEKIHLTLCFLGEVGDSRLGDVREAAASVRAPRFELSLDEVGSFREARVAWAGSSQAPKALRDFQNALGTALRLRAFALENRPFAVHVTLVRRIAGAVARSPIAAVKWRPREYALVCSERVTGGYRVLETWTLNEG